MTREGWLAAIDALARWHETLPAGTSFQLARKSILEHNLSSTRQCLRHSRKCSPGIG